MFERQSDPAIDSVLVRAPIRTDQKNSPHRTFRKVARADMRTIERCERGLGAKADHQFPLHHAATHIARDHKSEAAEHRFFNRVGAGGKHPPYPTSEDFAVGHYGAVRRLLRVAHCGHFREARQSRVQMVPGEAACSVDRHLR
jgi:hypothetical protein